jgi:hypothetical protein
LGLIFNALRYCFYGDMPSKQKQKIPDHRDQGLKKINLKKLLSIPGSEPNWG